MKQSANFQRPWRSVSMVLWLRDVATLMLCFPAVQCFADDLTIPDDSDAPAASEAEESPKESVVPFWQLDRGQTFLTTTNIRRATEMQVADYTRKSDETDRMQLAYGIALPDRVGGFRVGVRVQSMRREAKNRDEHSSQIEVLPQRDLAEMEMSFRVSDDGQQVTPYPGESLVPTHDLESRELLRRLCGPEVFRSWVDLPFRVPVMTTQNQLIPPRIMRQREAKPADPDDGAEAEKDAEEAAGLRVGFEWTRPQHVSLGLLGMLQMDCSYRVDSINEDTATIVIQGTGTVEPLSSPGRSMLTIESADLSVSEISGNGTVSMSGLPGVPESMRFSQKIAVEGTGVVRSGNESHKLRIKQLLTQEWIVSEFKYRDEPQGFPIPMTR
jgi:hypothetical protein